MKKLGILVSGKGSNMRAIIDACEAERLDASVALVISNNINAPALQLAMDKNIRTVCLCSCSYPGAAQIDNAMLRALQDADVELVVLAGFMKKIGPQTLAAYKDRIINIHPSLLPKYGGQGMFGIRVHEAVLANREQKTGATIHLVNDEYDQGAILAQEEVVIEADDDAISLAARVLHIEHRLYVETIQKIVNGNIILPIE